MGNYHKNQQKNFILQIKFMNKKKFIFHHSQQFQKNLKI